ncbi:N-formylglutamate amidohydrolase [Chenggangzhangella methanolivorans]|uniref:N-formylglutamate amidohydrolase n=1 Tax=Chenggangzhangella methanolivorans TaxID=1437009 RepID=A0A9E6RB99_9HYPH|nr:N-formylglutamate amidohydrolase [Chenggangzhangella methanolivorans]QZO01195.1 N-formylglutamate amidohydrolase [Chenggangzhangella methanolivorans]
MTAVDDLEALDPAFEILEPEIRSSAVTFNSPHSGARYPASFLAASRLDPRALRRSEDAFVDELFTSAPSFGAPLMRAHFPRAFVDVNREPYELDPRMFDGRLPPFANTRSLRVAGGLGTIARIVGDAQEIYGARLPVEEALDRIERIYKPYHRALRRLVARAHRAHGLALLIDCHSMPSIGVSRDDRTRADIVLGDRYGAACSPAIVDFVEHELRALGLQVTRNRPYAGGYITEHYGAPATDVHALQIEINRALYMNEQTHEKHRGFEELSAKLARLVEAIATAPLGLFGALRAAAE